MDRSGGPDACWPWPGASSDFGYGDIRHEGKTLKAHRVAWELTNGPIPEGLFALHTCDNPPCCNPAHLFLGTKKDNADDKIAKDRMPVGKALPQTKLTDDDVRFIREAYWTRSMSGREMARRFNVSETLISMVARGQQRIHVE